jgi:arylsulfatase A-like enzyme
MICCGQGVFKENVQIENARIYDLAPTILYLMDQQIPSTMDGRILFDIFTEKFLEKHKAQYKDTNQSTDTKDENALTEEEKAALADMLRSLGYVN